MTVDNRPEPQLEPMPMDRAILWNPPAAPGTTSPGRPSSRSPYPIFFQQEAVVALQEHLKGSPQQAIFGFLIGHLYRDPEAGVMYTVIDKVLRLNQPVYGDKTEVVVSRLWDRMQQQLAKTTGLLLGWYHSHPGQGGFLSPHDIETHQRFFTEPWQVAVLVAAEAGGVTGRFFRFSQTADWHKTALPFYELLQPDSIKPDGKKRSFITWRNYKAHGPTLTGPKPKPAPKAVAPPPEPEPAPDPEPEPEPEPQAAAEPEPEADRGFRIMRSSADDIPVIKTSADDEPAPAPVPMPPPPPPAPPPPPPRPKPKPAPPPPPPPPTPPPPPPPREPEPPPPPPKRTSADELPWAVTPESVASVPPPVLEPPAPPPPPQRRRTSSGKFRLLDDAAEPEVKKKKPLKKRRRRGGWFGRIMLVLLLLAAGGGGYWYFVMRPKGAPPPWAALVDRVKKLVARAPAPPPPPPRQAARPRPAPAPPPAAAPPVDATWARFDRLSDTLSRAVRNFRDRAALFASGQIDCNGLATGLVAIENLWISYSTERRARVAAGGLDPRRTTQDQALYAGVDSVESRFEQSGCRRP